MKRMKSKLHGFTHAIDGNEEAYLRKLGWIEESESFDGEAEAHTEVGPVSEESPIEDAPLKPARRKPGRKPKG